MTVIEFNKKAVPEETTEEPSAEILAAVEAAAKRKEAALKARKEKNAQVTRDFKLQPKKKK